jgi:hypothetical protein
MSNIEQLYRGFPARMKACCINRVRPMATK